MRDVIAFDCEEQMIIAVVPGPIYDVEEKAKVLTDYAKEKANSTSKRTIVTQDLSVFMMLSRMKKRGFDREEEARLIAKINSIERHCYIA